MQLVDDHESQPSPHQARLLKRKLLHELPQVQLLLNGVDANTAAAVDDYVGGAIATWAQQKADRAGSKAGAGGV